MCLILVAWQTLPGFPLVVAANRDEFYARPCAAAARWPEDPRVAGGRDLQAGGTWLGVREDGRFAAVTNVREPSAPAPPPDAPSRGWLPRDFLLGGQSPEAFAALPDAGHSGFNLLVGDRDGLWYRSNRDGPARRLAPGIYGLSNHRLDTPWPKLVSARARFASALSGLPAREAIFGILGDREIVPDPDLPATGVPLPLERMLSAIFVQSEAYGTRACTVLTWRPTGGVVLEERRFGPGGTALGASLIGPLIPEL
jgi:uncharacterized protein with NRDE domain